MHWPGRDPGPVTRRTSHYDLVPTLMERVLGCTNAPSDYASGGDLFDADGPGWEWMIAGSYFNFAIVEPDQVTVTYPGGITEVRDPDFRPLRSGKAPRERRDVLERALQETARFLAR